MRAAAFFGWGILSWASWPSMAAGQGNYHAAPLGGGAALRGGTGVALGRDGAAPFLNPATIARIEDDRLAFAARFFRISHQTLHDFHQPGPVDPALGGFRVEDASLVNTSLDTIPDSTCYFFARTRGNPDTGAGRSKLALCIGRTEDFSFNARELDFIQQANGWRLDQSQSFREEWSRWKFGPTFAIYLAKSLAVGGSVYLTRTNHQALITHSSVVEDTGAGQAITASYQRISSGSSWDTVADLGVLYEASPTWTLGASLRMPSIHFFGRYASSEDARFDDGSATVQHSGGRGTFRTAAPVRVAAGAGAHLGRVRLELDVFFHSGVNELARADFERSDVDTTDGLVQRRFDGPSTRVESANPVVNAGLGGEYFFRDKVSLVFGVASDLNAVPPLAPADEDRLFRSRFDAWHAGLGISSYTEHGDVTFGNRLDYMTGELLGVNGFAAPPTPARVGARAWGVMFVIAGRLNVQSLTSTATRVTDALAGEKDPAP
jgi:hypothetical protein